MKEFSLTALTKKKIKIKEKLEEQNKMSEFRILDH